MSQAAEIRNAYNILETKSLGKLPVVTLRDRKWLIRMKFILRLEMGQNWLGIVYRVLQPQSYIKLTDHCSHPR
jgi:hypothetical protein